MLAVSGPAAPPATIDGTEALGVHNYNNQPDKNQNVFLHPPTQSMTEKNGHGEFRIHTFIVLSIPLVATTQSEGWHCTQLTTTEGHEKVLNMKTTTGSC